ncbi:MAG TPA: MEDS domain-containing protein [Caulobacteraceae bacterium]|nr:MEDS domain-containing protein [Caulobacteraceae bacterium]
MVETLRQTGIEPLGEMPWGVHFCLFYEEAEDLLDVLVPYFAAGALNNERCVWGVSDPIDVETAIAALRPAIPDLDRRLAEHDIEILPDRELLFLGGRFDMKRVAQDWDARLAEARAKGFDGLRLGGVTFWVGTTDWEDFYKYECDLERTVTGRRLLVLCAYPAKRARAVDILDVARAHQFTLARRKGAWEVIETPKLRLAKQELLTLKAELEERVRLRTQELADVNARLEAENAERERAEAALAAAQNQLARSARFTTLGVLAASIAHEVNQPLAAIVTNSEASQRWLARTPPALEEARSALGRIVRDANRAGDVIGGIRALVAGRTERVAFDVNAAIAEVAIVTRGLLKARRIELRQDLALDAPTLVGDRLQLEQAIINLVANASDAMAEAPPPRDIVIRSRAGPDGEVVVAVVDRGHGLDAQTAGRIFDPFFTTKPGGMGLGLSIARAVAEAHGGRLSARPGPDGGAVFELTIPRDPA